MTNIKIKPGDIFLIDSNKTGAKIVKFFQTAPTWYQHLWRKIRKTQETVLYYHVGMFTSQEKIIEQQAKVVEKSSHRILATDKKIFIARRKYISATQKKKLLKEAFEDLGKGYDILNCIGKFLTWLTGFPIFARYLEYPDQEICINRVAQWYKTALGETFGAKTHSELTTHLIYKYIKSYPKIWKVVYEGVPNA